MIRQEWIQIRERIKERSHEMKQERCRANYVGVCFRGDACPYSHDPLIPIKERSQERKQVRRKVKRPERCRANYVGACIRGDACPYSHELLMPMRGRSSKQNAKDGYSGVDDLVVKPQQSPDTRESTAAVGSGSSQQHNHVQPDQSASGGSALVLHVNIPPPPSQDSHSDHFRPSSPTT